MNPSDLWFAVFHSLDERDGIRAETCGAIAQAVEDAYRAALDAHGLGDPSRMPLCYDAPINN